MASDLKRVAGNAPSTAPAERASPGLRWRRIVPVVAIVVLGIVSYANSFGGSFIFDDRGSIASNPNIRDLSRVLPGGIGYSRRWIGYLTFALNYRVGGLDVRGYHVTNLCIHLVNALLVYALVVVTFSTPKIARSRLAPVAAAIAFGASALFVTHPIQTEAVTYIVQRLTSLAASFYLAAVVQYGRWRTMGERARARSAVRYLSILVALTAGMMTKEIAFTAPAVIVLYHLAMFGRPTRHDLAWLAPIVATMAIIPLHLALQGGASSGVGAVGGLAAATRVQTEVSRWEYFLTEIAVMGSYLRLLVLPLGQNLDHVVASIHSLWDPRLLAPGAVLVLLAATGTALLATRPGEARRADPARRVVGFGIAWFLVASSVESSFIPIIDRMMEHRVYLPSVGLFLSTAVAVGFAADRWARRRSTVIAATCGAAAVVLAIATFARNEVWANEITMWSDVVAKSPGKSRGHNSLGFAFEAAGRRDAARAEYEESIRVDPSQPEGFYNLGKLVMTDEALPRRERALAAAGLFRRSLALRPSADAYANLAGAMNMLGQYADAVAVLDDAGPMVADSAEAHFNLAVAYWMTGDRRGAEREVTALRAIDRDLAARLDSFFASTAGRGPG